MKKFIKYISLILFFILLVSCGGEKTTTTNNNIHTNDKPEKCDHKFVEVMRQDSTCREPGLIDYECMYCFEHKHEELPLIDHQWTEWEVIYDATIDQEGLESRRCKHCGEEEQQSIPRLEHEHNYNIVDKKDPSCKEPGFVTYECECGDSYDEELGMLSHKFSQWEVLVEANCTQDGSKERICEDCGHKETENIPASGHHYVGNSCDKCGQSDVSYLSFELNSDKKGYTLVECSKTNITEVIVPNVYNNLPVTNIEYGAFEKCQNIVSITLPFVGGSLNPTEGSKETLFGYIFGLDNKHFNQGSFSQTNGSSYFQFSVPTNTLKNVTITGGEIHDYSLNGLSFVESIVLKEPITKVGVGNFTYINMLKILELPETLETFESNISNAQNIKLLDFSHCINLKSLGKISYADSLEKVILPESLEVFGGFDSCYSLKEVEMSSLKLKEIPQGFIYQCPLLTSFAIPEGVKKIGINAFFYSGLEEVIIPDTVEIIEWSAFQDCQNLEKVVMSKSLKELGSSAFKNCFKLKEIILPETLEVIGSDIFSGCSSLEKVTLPFVGQDKEQEESSDLTVLGHLFGTSQYDGSYQVRPFSYGTKFYIPNSLVEVSVLGGKILGNAFAGVTSLEKLTLGEDVESLGSSFINKCTNLTKIDLTNCKNLTAIDKSAFYSSSIKSITIPSSVEIIKENAFSNCKELVEVLFEENSKLETIEKNAFKDCSLLETITIPNCVKTIGQYALANCTSLNYLELSTFEYTGSRVLEYLFNGWNSTPQTLKTLKVNGETIKQQMFQSTTSIEKLIIGASVKTIEAYAFERCSMLKEVEFEDINSVNGIGESAFGSCYELTEFIIPTNITKIENNLLYSSKVSNITIPKNIESIGDNAFSYNYTLKSVIFEENSKLANIGNNVFNQTGIIEITLPNTVEYIGANAFYGCEHLTDLILSNKLKSIGNNAFSNCKSLKKLVLPDSVEYIGENILKLEFYSEILLESLTIPYLGQTNEENNMGLQYLFGDNFYNGSLEVIITKAKYISSGSMPNYVIALTLPETLEKIEPGVFNNSLSKVERLTVPFMGTKEDTGEIIDLNTYGTTIRNTLKEITILKANNINDNAFYYCRALEKVTFNSDVENIGYNAFYYCESLKEVEFKGSLNKISGYAFSQCRSLEKINLPEGLKTIENNSFSSCSSLTTVKLPQSLESLGEYAFIDCENIKKLNIPYNTVVAEKALSYMNGLEEISLHIDEPLVYYFESIPSTLKVVTVDCVELMENALTNIDSLEEIHTTNALIKINANSFTNTTNLKKLVLKDNVSEIAEGVLNGIANKLVWNNPRIIKSYMYDGYEGDQIIIKSSVETIETYAFYNTTAEIVWENPQIDTITKRMFAEYKGNKLVIPSNITNIESEAFYNTKANIIWENPQIDTITKRMFAEYKGSNLVIPSSVIDIESEAFYNTKANIIWENPQIKTLRENVFYYYSGDTINIPDSVENISKKTFNSTKANINWNNSKVETIAEKSFDGYLGENLVLPSTISTLETYAFAGYKGNINLDNITNIKTIPSYAFYQREQDLVLPLSVETLDSYALSNFKGNVTIPSSVTNIEANAFDNCTGDIIWDNPTITTIKTYAFDGYRNEELTIPNSVTSIEFGALYDAGVAKLTIPFVGANRYIKDGAEDSTFGHIFGEGNIEQYVFSPYTDVETKSFNISASIKEVVVTDAIKLACGAFSNCSNITKIQLNDILYIPNRAFINCTSLTEINIPNTVKYLHDRSFMNCTSLKNIELPDSLQSISDYSFYNCSKLSKIVIPENVETISGKSFYNCYNLVEVYNLSELPIIPNNNTDKYGELGKYAKIIYNSLDQESQHFIYDDKYMMFYDKDKDMYSLEYYFGEDLEIELPNTINDKPYVIRDYAFRNNTFIEKIYIPKTINSIGYAAFSGCSSIKEITIPFVGKTYTNVSSDETIFGYIFGSEEFDNSIKAEIREDYDDNPLSYYIPESLKTINVLGGNILDYAFYFCHGIEEIIIPEEVSYFGKYSFAVTNLNNFVLNEGLEEIDDYAFYDTDYNFEYPKSIKIIGKNAVPNVRDVYYHGTIEDWMNIKFENAGSNPINNGYLNLLNEKGEWERLREFVIPENITKIGDYQFKGLTAYCNIIIPSTITEIGIGAFYQAGKPDFYNMEKVLGTLDLSNLNIKEFNSTLQNNYSYVILPDTIEIIKTVSLSNPNLLEITIPSSVTKIEDYAFKGCTSLKKVTLTENITQMGYQMFKDCSSLEEITIPFVGKNQFFRETVEENGSFIHFYSTDNFLGYIFNDSPADGLYMAEQKFLRNSNEVVTKIAYIPETLKKITILKGIVISGALSDCRFVEEIDYQGEDGFDANSFENCYSLNTITLSPTIKYISANTFFGTENIKVVNFRGTKEEYDSIGLWASTFENATINYNYKE